MCGRGVKDTSASTGEGYLAAVLDLATRKIVGWSMREHMLTELTLAPPPFQLDVDPPTST